MDKNTILDQSFVVNMGLKIAKYALETGRGVNIIIINQPQGLQMVTNLEELPEKGINLHETLANVEKAYIKQALELTEGVKNHAAELLEIDTRTFDRKMKQHKLTG